jgi:hypothetical protein
MFFIISWYFKILDSHLQNYNRLILLSSTKTIDDAFDYVDNRDKSIIYLSDLPYDEKEKAIHQAELNVETRKQMLKSFLDFMSVKYKHNNQENNNNIKLINYE